MVPETKNPSHEGRGFVSYDALRRLASGEVAVVAELVEVEGENRRPAGVHFAYEGKLGIKTPGPLRFVGKVPDDHRRMGMVAPNRLRRHLQQNYFFLFAFCPIISK